MATAQNIDDRVRDILQDSDSIKWTEVEMMRWITDAQREVVQLKPDANPKTVTLTPSTAGSKQDLSIEVTSPDVSGTALRVLDVIRNTHTASAGTGKSIRRIDRSILDDQIPEWHRTAAKSTDDIDSYTFDDRNPKVFYIYPNAGTDTRLEVLCSAAPAEVTALTDTLTLDDIYLTPLVDYVVYRAFSKEADYTANESRAQQFRNSFYESLGIRQQVADITSPNA
ncbi:MAG: hypothetical protein HOE82_08525 [Gammaproteobacteria bacterium]|jgi:hypothetical protein|nr:hypothetical protein [Gammaproteobacteria bacterium]